MEEYIANVETEIASNELKQIKEILKETGFDWKVNTTLTRKSYLEKIS